MKRAMSKLVTGALMVSVAVGVLLLNSENVGAQLADSPWPMFRGNQQHTGRSRYDTSHVDGTVKWTFTLGRWAESSPVIGADGTIYIGDHDSKLYAIKPDGTEKWTFQAGEPVYSDYWEIWKGILSTPAIGSDGTIYFTSMANNLYAINPDGTEKWTFPIDLSVDVWSSPAIGADGTIYVGSHDNYQGKLYAINPEDGSKRWAFQAGSDVCSSPAIGEDGTIYVGSRDSALDQGKLYAINPEDGSKRWDFTTGKYIESSPAIGADGTIYIGSIDHNLYAINPDGSEKWRFYVLCCGWSSSPAIGSDGTIYVASDKLYALGTTRPDPPTVTTGSATSVTSTSATLTGAVNPNGLSTTYYFEYGTTTSYGSKTAETDAGSGTDEVSVNADLTGLSEGTTYHFRLQATNSAGTNYGDDATFTTTTTTTTTTTGGGGGGGCFIATACYETPMAEQVKILCAFRDKYLVKNPIGRAFVNFYYRYSPKVADFIQDKEHLKTIIRECLKPFILIISKIVK